MNGLGELAIVRHEAEGLLGRIRQLRPFSLRMPAVAAATIQPEAMVAIESHLRCSARELAGRVRALLAWLDRGTALVAEQAQHRLTVLRLGFDAVLAELDVFADALAQRSEHELGTWLAGLDALATDSMRLRVSFFEPPPLMCYVDRGIGAAIRRARTRLPTGASMPVAIIRVPRERMIGTGIAASLVHEAGHQAAASLRLVEALRPRLQSTCGAPWDRWISEIVADLWAVAKLGIAAPLGLLAVVSMPRPFVFRISGDDPHPTPWLRVKIVCAFGDALYPHPQWAALAHAWSRLYPTTGLAPSVIRILEQLQAEIPEVVDVVLTERPSSLRGATIGEALADPDRTPVRLRRTFRTHRSAINRMPPSLAFAVLGQARADGHLAAAHEGRIISDLLVARALSRVSTPTRCGGAQRSVFH
jgi:hypothetical protein